MSRIFKKIGILLKQKKINQFTVTCIAYLRFVIIRFWFFITFKEIDGNIKKVNKNWIIYSFVKSKYSRFLKNYKPQHNLNHEYSDIIWWCWLQGEENAPEICKACLASVRRYFPDKRINIVTLENMSDYVDFPDFVKRKFDKGIISSTHLSDLLRLELLIKYGGIWMDSTVFLTGRPDYVCNTPLFVFKTNERNDPGTVAQNWFISAEKNNPILILTRDFLYNYWKSEIFLLHYFIFYFFMNLASQFYAEEWKQIPVITDLTPHLLQREINEQFSDERWKQLCRMSDVHKLSYKIELSSEKNCFYQYILKTSFEQAEEQGE